MLSVCVCIILCVPCISDGWFGCSGVVIIIRSVHANLNSRQTDRQTEAGHSAVQQYAMNVGYTHVASLIWGQVNIIIIITSSSYNYNMHRLKACPHQATNSCPKRQHCRSTCQSRRFWQQSVAVFGNFVAWCGQAFRPTTSNNSSQLCTVVGLTLSL